MAKTDDEGKMSFLEHLGELRTRIIWSLIPTAIGILVAVVVVGFQFIIVSIARNQARDVA